MERTRCAYSEDTQCWTTSGVLKSTCKCGRFVHPTNQHRKDELHAYMVSFSTFASATSDQRCVHTMCAQSQRSLGVQEMKGGSQGEVNHLTAQAGGAIT